MVVSIRIHMGESIQIHMGEYRYRYTWESRISIQVHVGKYDVDTGAHQ